MKSCVIVAISIFLVASIVFFVSERRAIAPEQVVAVDYKNATYRIEGIPVTLAHGRAEFPAAPRSASKVMIQYFGNEAFGDLNGDGVDDVAFILTRQSGGSGTFYYVAAALTTTQGYRGSDAVLLGDRIAPQPTTIKDGKVIANYADRAPGENFSVRPSVGKSIWLKLDPSTMQFGEVMQNFEGEADPARMTLSMQTWTWISTLYNDGKKVTPKNTKAFTLTFNKDGTFSATTDCNAMSGTYTAQDKMISFGNMATTLMYCENSQESAFQKMLSAVQGYHFTSRGELVCDLKFDSGMFIFR